MCAGYELSLIDDAYAGLKDDGADLEADGWTTSAFIVFLKTFVHPLMRSQAYMNCVSQMLLAHCSGRSAQYSVTTIHTCSYNVDMA